MKMALSQPGLSSMPIEQHGGMCITILCQTLYFSWPLSVNLVKQSHCHVATQSDTQSIVLLFMGWLEYWTGGGEGDSTSCSRGYLTYFTPPWGSFQPLPITLLLPKSFLPSLPITPQNPFSLRVTATPLFFTVIAQIKLSEGKRGVGGKQGS